MKKALIVGDSNTWGYDPRGYGLKYNRNYVDYLNDLVPEWLFFSDAENGRLLRDVIDESFDLSTIDLFCVMLGSNDLMHYYSVNQILSFMKTLILQHDKSRMMILAPPILKIPAFEDESKLLNEKYQTLDVKFLDSNPLDISFDGIHLSEKGHQQLALKISRYFKRLNL